MDSCRDTLGFCFVIETEESSFLTRFLGSSSVEIVGSMEIIERIPPVWVLDFQLTPLYFICDTAYDGCHCCFHGVAGGHCFHWTTIRSRNSVDNSSFEQASLRGS